MALLFSPRSPTADESILVITDECFPERKGFRLRFGDLLAFAQEDYPPLWQPSVAFFQPRDMIFLAERSRLLVLLHHEGLKARHAAEIV